MRSLIATHLVLVRFDDFNNTNRNITDVGDYCSLTFIPYATGSHVMRIALLDFLVEAWQQL